MDHGMEPAEDTQEEAGPSELFLIGQALLEALREPWVTGVSGSGGGEVIAVWSDGKSYRYDLIKRQWVRLPPVPRG